MITKYTGLTDRELLLRLSDARQHSPVIEELCRRLEDIPEECPVCEARQNSPRMRE